METKLVLTPMQFFYLGSLLDASYIDYSYVSAIESFEESFKLLENEIVTELIQKGVVSEDFSGNKVIDEDYIELLSPVFSGNKEIELSECSFLEPSLFKCFKFHYSDKGITCICPKDDSFEVSSVSSDMINALINEISSNFKNEEAGSDCLNIDDIEVSGLLSVKFYGLNTESIVRNYIISDRSLISVNEDDELVHIRTESFYDDTISLTMR